MSILLMVAVIPPLYLMHRIYNLDKIEKEPKKLVWKLLLAGMLITFPCAIAEQILIGIAQAVFGSGTLFLLAVNFLCVGLSEEGFKYLAAKNITWRNPEFNYRFDGIVYCAAVSLGFALLENVMYVFSSGVGGIVVAVVRAVTSIPGHCTFGIIMGYYYGEAKRLANLGDAGGSRSFLKCALWIPLILHGTYAFVLSTQSALLGIFFVFYVIWLDLRALKRVRDSSAADMPV